MNLMFIGPWPMVKDDKAKKGKQRTIEEQDNKITNIINQIFSLYKLVVRHSFEIFYFLWFGNAEIISLTK